MHCSFKGDYSTGNNVRFSGKNTFEKVYRKPLMSGLKIEFIKKKDTPKNTLLRGPFCFKLCDNDPSPIIEHCDFNWEDEDMVMYIAPKFSDHVCNKKCEEDLDEYLENINPTKSRFYVNKQTTTQSELA